MSLSFDWADGLRAPAPKCKARIVGCFVREGRTFLFELARRAPRWAALGQGPPAKHNRHSFRNWWFRADETEIFEGLFQKMSFRLDGKLYFQRPEFTSSAKLAKAGQRSMQKPQKYLHFPILCSSGQPDERARSREPRAESRAESREPRAESSELGAESRGLRAESRETRAAS